MFKFTKIQSTELQTRSNDKFDFTQNVDISGRIQYENYKIFLSIRILVKSILVIEPRVSKSAISTNSEALLFEFYEFCTFSRLKTKVTKI